MRRDGTVAPLVGRALVAGHAFPLREHFHDVSTQAYIELLFNQRVGHRVVVAFDFHVVIDIDTNLFPLGIFVGLNREGLERRAVERRKQLLA